MQLLKIHLKNMVGASRFGGQVPLEGAQSKRHFISRSHPRYSDGFTAGPARSPSRGRAKSRSLFVATALVPPAR
ncbi:MAG TPA: hypothetical protein VK568_05350 [Thermodesulfobacteriota bacterium]|nr:hypothetical protein [Thermodesulfobacteriota bacterium]